LSSTGHRLLALAVDTDADHVALVDLELQPGTAARDELGGEDVLVGRLVGGALEVGTRATDQLRDDDPLGAVDDEGARSVMSGKSPMNTVWLLISPVLVFMNSAVTNRGAS
jgi:hypothetical protein